MSGTVGTVLIREVPRSEGVLYKVVPPLMDGKSTVCMYVCVYCMYNNYVFCNFCYISLVCIMHEPSLYIYCTIVQS